MRLQGRLTRHFLNRVALLVGALGTVFFVWLIWLSVQSGQIRYNDVTPVEVLRQAADETTLTADSGVAVSTETAASVRRGDYWLQVLDENGDVITDVDAPADAPTHYTPGNLVHFRQSPGQLGQAGVYTWAAGVGDRELTFVLGEPTKGRTEAVYLGPVVAESDGASLTELLILVGVGVTVILGAAVIFARSLVRPMNHMMSWLGALAAGSFTEPVDRRGRSISRTRDGRSRRKPYSTYREVFDSLDSLAAELGRAEAERTRLDEAREEWIAGVTHDLRTPLTSVGGYADLLASDYEFSPEEVRRYARIVAGQTSHMDALIDDLTLTFRLSADALPLARERVDLVEVVREAAVDLANDPRAAGREVVFDEPPGSGRIEVEADPDLFRRALANLLTNAAVHNAEGTTVRAAVVREGTVARVRISDDGSGMDAITLSRLFDRYYRGTSTASTSEGSGLGMAIARQIVEAHGGDVEAWSEPGTGTVITLRIPVAS